MNKPAYLHRPEMSLSLYIPCETQSLYSIDSLSSPPDAWLAPFACCVFQFYDLVLLHVCSHGPSGRGMQQGSSGSRTEQSAGGQPSP